MGWLQRFRGDDSGAAAPEAAGASGSPAPSERASPGLAMVFERLSPDGRHSILDLGTASRVRLRLLGRYARQIRFAGVVPPPVSTDLASLVAEIPAHPQRPYDLVLAWDILDHLDAPLQAALVRRIAEITSPDAWLYVVARSDGRDTVRPRSIDLLDLDRVAERTLGPPLPAGPEVLPAQMEKLLEPFRVVRGVSLRTGSREYVATRRPRSH